MRNIEALQEQLIRRGPKIECVVEPQLQKFYHTGNLPAGWSVHRLRLDWEIGWLDQGPSTDHAENIPAMFTMVENDLRDILVNGDEDSPIAGLNVMNGEVKRGKRALDSGIVSGVFYAEQKPRKSTTEYTLYLLFATLF